MAAWKCGWCGVFAHMEPRGLGHNVPAPKNRRTADGGSSVMFATMECSSCRGFSVALASRNISGPAPSNVEGMSDFWRNRQPIKWEPRWVEGQDFDYAPDHIAKAASESYKCHSIGAHMAAILMARTCIEAAAKDHGIRTGNLFEKIDRLVEVADLRKKIQRAAHQVRLFGNEMAHGDIEIEVTENDSAQILRLLTMILEDLYEVNEVLGQVGISLEDRKSGEAE